MLISVQIACFPRALLAMNVTEGSTVHVYLQITETASNVTNRSIRKVASGAKSSNAIDSGHLALN